MARDKDKNGSIGSYKDSSGSASSARATSGTNCAVNSGMRVNSSWLAVSIANSGGKLEEGL